MNFTFDSRWRGRQVGALLRRLPPLEGRPLQIEAAPGLRDHRGPVDAGSFIRERRMAFACNAAEFSRVFLHELFHFVWVRLGNARRREWEEVLRCEVGRGSRGDLGWSAEWRKRALRPEDPERRTRRWREYCCEAFCDTAAWIHAAPQARPMPRYARPRRAWFESRVERGSLSI